MPSLLRSLATLAAVALLGCSTTVTTPSGSGGAGAGGSSSMAWEACTTSKDCPNGGVCVFGPDSCGADAQGLCVYPYSCDGPPDGPICLCNGEVYEGEYGCTHIGPYAKPELCQQGTFAAISRARATPRSVSSRRVGR
jgi:hypothetical protein